MSEEEGEEVKELEDNDMVGKALQKCAKISADLRKELHGSSAPVVSDRYAKVEATSVRIVNQDDIIEACRSKDSDFQPILKPYQLVGVNFLLLLYQKGIGGDHSSTCMSFLFAYANNMFSFFFFFGNFFKEVLVQIRTVRQAMRDPDGTNPLSFHCQEREQKDDRKILKRWQWSYVLMDEARSANQRLTLTGTPLQNDLHV
ncbi:SWI/SNF-related matrix-associated actin-dependent regulated protein 1B [Pyrus ussuriensis x Pyrus communis]|uniref:SWI/SNF-related matrix-associated actin-dependent regulated protein 1B n=1 Tax=Pyrus ussuriensis x Pyrus communis TaxID=2448454 RepID=A0A5N5F9T7_9ROSA|nr:SWI/SNF-related matrix-associated actin-dependent regulated protein 1B [Pyrus ussuriensis x Pyrus communis]